LNTIQEGLPILCTPIAVAFHLMKEATLSTSAVTSSTAVQAAHRWMVLGIRESHKARKGRHDDK
jgi:hypothetical protein